MAGNQSDVISNSKAVLLDGFFSDEILFFYDDSIDKYQIFRRNLEDGLKNSEMNIYGYYHTTLLPEFKESIEDGTLKNFELRSCLQKMPGYIKKCGINALKSDKVISLRFLFDFSRVDDLDLVIQIKEMVKELKEQSFPISGVYAINIKNLSSEEIYTLSQDIPRVIMLSSEENVISFATPTDKTSRLQIVDQHIIDDVIKKSLEPLIISALNRPVSGYDIVKDINARFHVMIPMARIYSYLYNLEEEHILKSTISGRSKIYEPTPEGRKYLDQKLESIAAVYSHIIGF